MNGHACRARSSLIFVLVAVLPVLAPAQPVEEAARGEIVALLDRWQPPLDRAFGCLAAAVSPAQAVLALDALAGQGIAVRSEAMQLLGRYPFLRRAGRMMAMAPVLARVWSAAARYNGIVSEAARRFAAEPLIVERIRRLRALAGVAG